jgi:hypothetical protein
MLLLLAGFLLALISFYGQTCFSATFSGEISGETRDHYALSQGLWAAIYAAGMIASAAAMVLGSELGSVKTGVAIDLRCSLPEQMYLIFGYIVLAFLGAIMGTGWARKTAEALAPESTTGPGARLLHAPVGSPIIQGCRPRPKSRNQLGRGQATLYRPDWMAGKLGRERDEWLPDQEPGRVRGE